MSFRSTKFTSVISACILSIGVRALPGWPGGGTAVTGNAVQFDQATWETNLAHPNATGELPVTGFDISQKWPSQEVDGWRVGINVSSDVSDSQTMNPGNATGKAFTGTSIFLRGPGNVQGAFTNQSAVDETTWKICVAVLPNGPQDASAPDNGTCSFLSSECVSDIQQAYADKFSRSQDCYGTPPSTPASCGDSAKTTDFVTQQFPLDSVNGREVFVTASDSHDVGDVAAKDTAMNQVWPVLTIWGWNVRANAPDDASPRVQLSCIRAGSAVTGNESAPSSGSKSHAPPVLALAVAGLVAYALL
ncbi:hypothetical protein F4779DRAFT_185676 [Xylariaceae sp. FL0662B]|nr:hypothetical protein F4779DRAFT_185676 [Xylariaceae sp. FL0662B]